MLFRSGVARHRQWFSSEVDRSLASFTSYVLMPCLFFHRIIQDRALTPTLDAWYPAVVGFACTGLSILIAVGVAKFFGRSFGLENDSHRRTFGLTAGIDNYGYIPLPLADVFFPGCMVALMVHNVGVDLALWSVGLYTISGKGLSKSWKRIVFSPPLLAVCLAVLLKWLGWSDSVPRAIIQVTEKLGRCSVPIGLVLSGAILYDYGSKIKWGRAGRVLGLAIVVRMLLLPWICLAVAAWGTSSIELKQVLLLQAAMPAATFPIVMTRLYNQDVETAWTVVVGTSILSFFTIPLWMVFGGDWLALG